MSTPITDQLLVLEVSLTTHETQVHSYPIPPYTPGNEASITHSLDMVMEVLEEVRKLLAGEVKALKYPWIAYNPAHVVRVKIDGLKAQELMDKIPQEQRPLGFAT